MRVLGDGADAVTQLIQRGQVNLEGGFGADLLGFGPLGDGAIVDASFFDDSFPYLKTPLPGSPGQAEPHVPLPTNPLLPGMEPIAGP